ncbi:MAG: hypothetical protein FWG25_02975 [Promicromonosporaceae bacterium]|nr:hypothetical protein [Promicromonosporaceae bacterium]
MKDLATGVTTGLAASHLMQSDNPSEDAAQLAATASIAYFIGWIGIVFTIIWGFAFFRYLMAPQNQLMFGREDRGHLWSISLIVGWVICALITALRRSAERKAYIPTAFERFVELDAAGLSHEVIAQQILIEYETGRVRSNAPTETQRREQLRTLGLSDKVIALQLEHEHAAGTIRTR